MSDETSKQRIKREIENDIKYILKSIDKNSKKAEDLASELQTLFKQQECKHNWINTGSFLLSVYRCTKCGREDAV